jgi:2-amino-4-hydroxy-6-hydroxymethyldihydropteridine diphosphokinase
MILIGLGGNLPSRVGDPEATLRAAMRALEEAGVEIRARSRFYRSAPVPASDQPWYVNAAIAVATDLSPRDLLLLLHRIEANFGRVRLERNEPRSLDLDLLAYDDRVEIGATGGPILPHPRLSDRDFVLLPLRDIAPEWRHPVTGKTVDALIAALPPGQETTLVSG